MTLSRAAGTAKWAGHLPQPPGLPCTTTTTLETGGPAPLAESGQQTSSLRSTQLPAYLATIGSWTVQQRGCRACMHAAWCMHLAVVVRRTVRKARATAARRHGVHERDRAKGGAVLCLKSQLSFLLACPRRRGQFARSISHSGALWPMISAPLICGTHYPGGKP